MFKVYVAESVKMILESVAKGLGVESAKYMEIGYVDLVYPDRHTSESPEDIIDRISQKLQEYE